MCATDIKMISTFSCPIVQTYLSFDENSEEFRLKFYEKEFFTQVGLKSLLDRKTMLVAQSPLRLQAYGRILGKGCFPGQNQFAAALAALERIVTGDLKLPSRTREDLIRQVGWFLVDKLLLDINPPQRGFVDKQKHMRDLFHNKPASFTDDLLQKEERVNRGFEQVKKRGGFFCKAECVFKEVPRDDGIEQVSSGLQRYRGIYTMSFPEYMQLYKLLELFEVFLDGETIKRWHVKHRTQSEIGDLFWKIVIQGETVNTDFSAFESSLTGVFQELECYLMCKLAIACGYPELVGPIRKYAGNSRKYSNKCFFFLHLCRISGVFWTSFANLLCNLVVIACSHYSMYETGDSDLEEWWTCFVSESRMAEGDDAVTMAKSINPELIAQLGFKFSILHSAFRGCDINILKMSLIPGGLALKCPLRLIASLMVRTTQNLKRSKHLYLLRMGALGLAHSCAGMPIVIPLVKRIKRLTSGISAFKGWQNWISSWNKDLPDESKGWPRLFVSQELRVIMAETLDPTLTRVSIEQQFAQERLIDAWNLSSSLFLVEDLLHAPTFSAMFSAPTCQGSETDGREGPKVHDWLVRLGALPGDQSLVEEFQSPT